jgi:predicted glutamine amidotransferase
MCIIIAKNKTNRLPSKKELEYCFDYNNDGAGFMYTDNGKVILDKGYMTKESFMARYKTLCKKYNNFKDKCLVIHCRIGTAGTNSPQNTHPYALTKKINKLHKTYTKASVGIAHNGIIMDYQPHDGKDINDTQNFIRTYMVQRAKEDKEFYKRQWERTQIEDITHSKFAILDKDDNLYLIGVFTKEDNLLFSNSHYKPVSYSYYYKDNKGNYGKREYGSGIYSNPYYSYDGWY